MSYIETINNFNSKYNAQIDGAAVSAAIANFLTTTKDNAVRNDLIKAYVIKSYRSLAQSTQTAKMKNQLLGANNVPKTTAKEMLDEYVELVSLATVEASTKLTKDAEQAVIDAKAEIEAAKEAEANALAEVQKLNTKQNRDAYASAKAKAEIKSSKEVFTFEPYEQTENYFGMTSKEAEKLLTAQLNHFSNLDACNFLVENLGVKNPRFINEVNEHPAVNYNSASAEQKKSLQNIYRTKTIMQEKLNEKGISAWFWRLFHRSDVKAMKNYVKASNELLTRSNFEENAISDVETTANQGYGYSSEEIKIAVDEYKVILASADKREEEREAERQAQEKERIERENALKSEIKTVNEKDTKERMFDIRFRPSFDKATRDAEYAEFKKIVDSKKSADATNSEDGKKAETTIELRKNTVNTKELPFEAREVFKANLEKFRIVKTNIKENITDEKLEELKGSLETKFRGMEEKFVSNEKYKDYKGMTLDEFYALPDKEIRKKIDFKNDLTENAKIEPKLEDETLKKEAPQKNV